MRHRLCSFPQTLFLLGRGERSVGHKKIIKWLFTFFFPHPFHVSPCLFFFFFKGKNGGSSFSFFSPHNLFWQVFVRSSIERFPQFARGFLFLEEDEEWVYPKDLSKETHDVFLGKWSLECDPDHNLCRPPADLLWRMWTNPKPLRIIYMRWV